MSTAQSGQNLSNGLLSPELIIAVIGGIISTVIGTLFVDWIKSRTTVKVKLLTKSTDKDVEGFVELYDKLIDENQRIDPAEIISWIDEDRVLRKLETHNYLHYLFVGKLSGSVVSFLKTMYCKDTQYMFIAYYGIDTSVERARRLAAPAMMKSLANLIKKDLKDCKAVIAEVEPPNMKIDERENTERRARIRLFKETANRLSYPMYEIGIKYLQPQMEIADDEKYLEEESILLYAPVSDPKPYNKKIPKEKVLDILRFIYLQIYRPTFRHDPENDFSYQRYLNTLLQHYETTLPDTVSLKG